MNGEIVIPLKIQNSPVEKITVGSICNKGARPYQEDSFGFSLIDKKTVSEYGFSAVLGDGMGGLSGGSFASDSFVTAMLELHCSRNISVPAHIHLKRSIREINERLIASGTQGGTTAVAAMCLTSGVYWCTLGDSRIYLFRNGIPTALSEDTDYLNRLLDDVIKGNLSINQALSDPKKDSLEQYIGFKGDIFPDGNIRPLIPQKNDRLLLCSDGVYNALSSSELCKAMEYPPGEAAKKLEEMVLSKGFCDQDNFTAVILCFG